MSLEKNVSVDRVEVLANGCVQVRTLTVILDNGVQVGGSFHRHVIAPGDDFSAEEQRVKDICSVAHTADVVAAFKAAQGV